MSRGRVIADLDAGTKRDTAVSELVGLITASQDTGAIRSGSRTQHQ
jgi:hypothetical protein